MTHITYIDPRFGDIYHIQLDAEGKFLSALRYIDRIGNDPITYDSIYEIPQVQRRAIEHLLWKRSSQQ